MPSGQDWSAALPATSSGPLRWLMDTGCGHDLIGRCDVPSWAKAFNAASPVLFSTANGTTSATEQVPIEVPSLRDSVRPYLLRSSPAVLSIGRRCAEEGYGFYWPPKGLPILETPTGQCLQLEVEGYIPYLPTTAAVVTVPPEWRKQGTTGEAVPAPPVPFCKRLMQPKPRLSVITTVNGIPIITAVASSELAII